MVGCEIAARGPWSSRVLECSSAGVVECWNARVLECSSAGTDSYTPAPLARPGNSKPFQINNHWSRYGGEYINDSRTITTVYGIGQIPSQHIRTGTGNGEGQS